MRQVRETPACKTEGTAAPSFFQPTASGVRGKSDGTMFSNCSIMANKYQAGQSPMLITDSDDRSRQGSLWRAEQRETTGSIPPANSVFFALYPDPHTARRLDRLAWYLRHKHRLNGRPLADRRLHVSLYNIGDYVRLTSEAAAAIGAAMATITMPPFLVAFNQAKSFNGGHKQPIVLVGEDGVAGLIL